jgi:polysaccharide export outer membrane protein
MRWLASLALLLIAVPPDTRQEYEIGPGDVLHVAVFGQADMTGDFTVDADGIMAFPFLGKIKASGLAASDLERKLTTLLADGYLRKPHVAVQVKEFHSQRVFVTGEVQRPGPYGLRPERSLLALLRDVGDLTSNAGHEVIVIRPPHVAGAGNSPEELPNPDASPAPVANPQPSPTPTPAVSGLPGEVPGSEVYRLSLRDVRSGNPDKDVRLETGDTVYFPKAAQVYVTGNVGRPGAFRFDEGLTVYQALNLAGGITERGSSKGVKVVRIVEGQRKELKLKPNDVLQPEDTVVVPERFF